MSVVIVLLCGLPGAGKTSLARAVRDHGVLLHGGAGGDVRPASPSPGAADTIAAAVDVLSLDDLVMASVDDTTRWSDDSRARWHDARDEMVGTTRRLVEDAVASSRAQVVFVDDNHAHVSMRLPFFRIAREGALSWSRSLSSACSPLSSVRHVCAHTAWCGGSGLCVHAGVPGHTAGCGKGAQRIPRRCVCV
jgi:predicted ATPase